MNKIDIDKQTFFSYALYIGRQRGYQKAWASMVFKANFGTSTVGKDIYHHTLPQIPSQDFLEWFSLYEQKVKQEYIAQKNAEFEKERQAEIEAKRKKDEQEKTLRKEKAKKERQKPYIQAYYAQRSHDARLLNWTKNNGILNE